MITARWSKRKVEVTPDTKNLLPDTITQRQQRVVAVATEGVNIVSTTETSTTMAHDVEANTSTRGSTTLARHNLITLTVSTGSREVTVYRDRPPGDVRDILGQDHHPHAETGIQDVGHHPQEDQTEGQGHAIRTTRDVITTDQDMTL